MSNNLKILKKKREYFQEETLNGSLRIKLTDKSIEKCIKLGYIVEKTVTIQSKENIEEIKTYEIVEGKEKDLENWLIEDFDTKIEFYKNDDNNWKQEKINGRIINVPKDWLLTNLSNIAKFQNGFSFNKSNYVFEDTGYEIMEVGSISINGGYNYKVKNKKYVNKNNLKEVQKYCLQINDIIIPMSDMSYEKVHVGTPYLIDRKNLYLNQRVGRIFDIKLCSKYFYYNIKQNQKYFGLNAQGQGPFNLGTKPILNYTFLYTSSILEQTLIAVLLTKLDNQIEELEEKIVIHKKQREYFQEETLSGSLRIKLTDKSIEKCIKLGYIVEKTVNIPSKENIEEIKTYEIVEGKEKDFENWLIEDFDTKIEFYKNADNNWKQEKINGRIVNIPFDWFSKKYSDYFKSRMGETILEKNLTKNGNIPVYSATESDKFFGFVNFSKVKLKKNDIVIPARGNSIGFMKIVKSESTGTQTTILSSSVINDKNNTKYIYETLLYFKNKGHIFKIEGGAIPQLTVKELNNFDITIPITLLERTLIAVLLTKFDNLIEGLEN